jgi:YVTN family beta-propeller protein
LKPGAGLQTVSIVALLLASFLAAAQADFARVQHEDPSWLSPSGVLATKDGKTLFIACATANRVLCFDTASRKLSASIALPGPPSGLALSTDERQLVVACAGPQSIICLIGAGQTCWSTIVARHTATAPVLGRDGRTLYVCNRFNNNVSVFDLATKKERQRIPV